MPPQLLLPHLCVSLERVPFLLAVLWRVIWEQRWWSCSRGQVFFKTWGIRLWKQQKMLL